MTTLGDGVLDTALLQASLDLDTPWYLASAEACQATGRLHIGLAYPDGSRFACPRCGIAECPVDLDWPRIWRHPDFFGYQTYLLTRLPDLSCDRCGIVPAAVRWERQGFVLLTLNPARPGLAEWCVAGSLLILDRVAHDLTSDPGSGFRRHFSR